MSMSTHVVGIRPPDYDWKRMKAVWEACEQAKIKIPDEVLKFFGHEEPDEAGVVVGLFQHPCLRNWSNDSGEGFEVEIDKLPAGVKIIRFYNSW